MFSPWGCTPVARGSTTLLLSVTNHSVEGDGADLVDVQRPQLGAQLPPAAGHPRRRRRCRARVGPAPPRPWMLRLGPKGGKGFRSARSARGTALVKQQLPVPAGTHAMRRATDAGVRPGSPVPVFDFCRLRPPRIRPEGAAGTARRSVRWRPARHAGDVPDSVFY